MNNKTERHLHVVPDLEPATPIKVYRLTPRGKRVLAIAGATALAGGIGFTAFATPENHKAGVSEVLTGEDKYVVQPDDTLEGVMQKTLHPETLDNEDPAIQELVTLEANAVGPYIRDEHLPEEIKVTNTDRIASYELQAGETILIPTTVE